MRDPFLDQQWQELNERLERCADHLSSGDPSLKAMFSDQAAAFAKNEPPQRYPDLLDRVREAAGIAIQWQDRRAAQSSQAEPAGTQPHLAVAAA